MDGTIRYISYLISCFAVGLSLAQMRRGSPSARKVVDKSVLFKDPIWDAVGEKGTISKEGEKGPKTGVNGRSIDLETPPFSPSARRHHTYGWLTGEFSVVGNNVKPEEWRRGTWEHVDVRRYVAKATHPRW